MSYKYAHNFKLIRARKAMGWTQLQAADAVGVCLQTYWAWENYSREPQPHWLKKLCEAFGVEKPKDLGF